MPPLRPQSPPGARLPGVLTGVATRPGSGRLFLPPGHSSVFQAFLRYVAQLLPKGLASLPRAYRPLQLGRPQRQPPALPTLPKITATDPGPPASGKHVHPDRPRPYLTSLRRSFCSSP